MRKLALMVHIGPGEQESARLADLLDSAFAYEPGIAWLVVVDDRGGAHPCPVPSLPGHCRPLVVANPKEHSKHPHEGGLCVGDVAGFLAVLKATDADLVVKVDTDSLIIGPFSETLDRYFETHPGAGMAGSLGVSCDPTSPLYKLTRPARASVLLMYRIVEQLRQQYAQPPRHEVSITTAYADVCLSAEQIEAAYRMFDILSSIRPLSSIGEFLHGGGYALPRRALERFREMGWFEKPLLWRDLKLGEDLFVSLLTQAAGYSLADLSGKFEPFAVQQYGLPFQPMELIERGHAIIHSLKNCSHASEADLRAWFRSRRTRCAIRQASNETVESLPLRECLATAHS